MEIGKYFRDCGLGRIVDLFGFMIEQRPQWIDKEDDWLEVSEIAALLRFIESLKHIT